MLHLSNLRLVSNYYSVHSLLTLFLIKKINYVFKLILYLFHFYYK